MNIKCDNVDVTIGGEKIKVISAELSLGEEVDSQVIYGSFPRHVTVTGTMTITEEGRRMLDSLLKGSKI